MAAHGSIRLVAGLLLALALTAVDQSVAAPPGRYVINLRVSVRPLTKPSLTELAGVPGVRVYTTETDLNGNHWYFLRVGFFASRAEAEALLPRLRGSYPHAKVIKITRYELARVTGRRVPVATTSATVADMSSPSATMQAARLAMTQGQYDQAITLYHQALDDADPAVSRQAMELLGVAQERSGDLRAAHRTYEHYLTLYPKGEASDRVRQRLAAIDTANAAPKAQLKEVKRATVPSQNYLFGSVYAVYRRQVSDGITNYSALTGYLDVTDQLRQGDYETKARISASRNNSYVTGSVNQTTLSTLSLGVVNRAKDWSLSFGRQTGSTGGVMGRYDGLQGSVRVSRGLRLNAVIGAPVDQSTDLFVNRHKQFFSLSADLIGLAKQWDFQFYALQQRADGFTDRRSIGSEVRYFKNGRSFFGLLDYDLQFKQLNMLTMFSTWTLSSSTTFHASLDSRKSPLLSTSNALIGQLVETSPNIWQPITSLSDLSNYYTSAQIQQLALDRTADMRNLTIGFAHDLSERYQVTADLGASDVSATPGSPGITSATADNIAATPATGTEYYLSTQLIGRSARQAGDIYILGLQYSHNRTLDTVALRFDKRFTRASWLINPRIQIEDRDDRTNAIKYWMARPSLLASFRRWRNHTFDFELGGDYSSSKTVPNDYYFSLGYRWDF